MKRTSTPDRHCARKPSLSASHGWLRPSADRVTRILRRVSLSWLLLAESNRPQHTIEAIGTRGSLKTEVQLQAPILAAGVSSRDPNFRVAAGDKGKEKNLPGFREFHRCARPSLLSSLQRWGKVNRVPSSVSRHEHFRHCIRWGSINGKIDHDHEPKQDLLFLARSDQYHSLALTSAGVRCSHASSGPVRPAFRCVSIKPRIT